MKLHTAVALLATALLTAIFTLFEMGYVDADHLADEVFILTDHDYREMKTVPALTVSNDHVLDAHKAPKGLMMKKRIAVTTVAILLFAVPLHAVFGIGDVVFDPTSYANAVLMFGQLVKSYEQLQTQFNLQFFLSQVVPVDMGSRYRTPAVSVQPLSVPSDQFGNLGPWVQQLNQGGSAGNAYNSATIPLQAYGPNVAQWPGDEQQKLASQYASLEFADGTNIDSMGVIGQLRGNANAADQAIAALEADSLSSDPAMNTEVGVLNKINAATIAQVRSSRDTIRLLLQTLEQQLADSKRRRDTEAAEMNAQIGRMEQGAAVKAQYTSTITDTLHSFRWQ